MRVLLFTGKGGVGKTTIAAATAVRAAKAGKRTLVMSTDPAHSLADSFDVELGPESREIAPNLWAEQIDAQERLEANWREIQEYMVSLMNWAGVDAIQAEELSVLPGLDEIFSLIDVKRYVDAGRHDLLVVDCAPTAETLRLLSLPEIMNWHIESVHESFQPVPILTAKLFDREMVGMELLERMGEEVYGGAEVTDVLHVDEPIRVRKRGATYVLSMRLPFADREELDVHRKGDELYIRVGPYKRNIILPQTLQRLSVQEARFDADRLEVRFAREPRPATGVGAGAEGRG